MEKSIAEWRQFAEIEGRLERYPKGALAEVVETLFAAVELLEMISDRVNLERTSDECSEAVGMISRVFQMKASIYVSHVPAKLRHEPSTSCRPNHANILQQLEVSSSSREFNMSIYIATHSRHLLRNLINPPSYDTRIRLSKLIAVVTKHFQPHEPSRRSSPCEQLELSESLFW